jgi:uncharacterized protein YbjT (DUF2867 family)
LHALPSPRGDGNWLEQGDLALDGRARGRGGADARNTITGVARILLVGGGCRGRSLASELAADGHAIRITTRSEERRAVVEEAGAECWIGTPDRLETLRGALEGVTLACWLLGSAGPSAEDARALYTSRLEAFMRLLIDTTVRGLVYETAERLLPADLATDAERMVRRLAEHNLIPYRIIRSAALEQERWVGEALAAVRALLGP